MNQEQRDKFWDKAHRISQIVDEIKSLENVLENLKIPSSPIYLSMRNPNHSSYTSLIGLNISSFADIGGEIIYLTIKYIKLRIPELEKELQSLDRSPINV